jgi:hypothetical protein
MNFQRFEENCPYVQLAVPEHSKKGFTVVLETTVDIIKWFEGSKKIINISHTFAMNCSSVFNMFVFGRIYLDLTENRLMSRHLEPYSCLSRGAPVH